MHDERMEPQAPNLNEAIELSLVLERQILEILSAARVDRHDANCVLDAVKAHLGQLPSGTHV